MYEGYTHGRMPIPVHTLCYTGFKVVQPAAAVRPWNKRKIWRFGLAPIQIMRKSATPVPQPSDAFCASDRSGFQASEPVGQSTNGLDASYDEKLENSKCLTRGHDRRRIFSICLSAGMDHHRIKKCQQSTCDNISLMTLTKWLFILTHIPLCLLFKFSRWGRGPLFLKSSVSLNYALTRE